MNKHQKSRVFYVYIYKCQKRDKTRKTSILTTLQMGKFSPVSGNIHLFQEHGCARFYTNVRRACLHQNAHAFDYGCALACFIPSLSRTPSTHPRARFRPQSRSHGFITRTMYHLLAVSVCAARQSLTGFLLHKDQHMLRMC